MIKNIIIIVLVLALITMFVFYILKKKAIDLNPYNPNDSTLLGKLQMKYRFTSDKDGILYFTDGTTSKDY